MVDIICLEVMVDPIHYPSKHAAIQGFGQSIPTIIGLDYSAVAKNLLTCMSECGVCVCVCVCSMCECGMCVYVWCV